MNGYSKGLQTFSHEKHYILCPELKNLYVAVTRARRRLWIFDENTEYSEPMREYWVQKGLVNEEKSSLSSFAKESSLQEWYLQGKKFFERRQYKLVDLF